MEDQKENLQTRFRNRSWTKPDLVPDRQLTKTPDRSAEYYGLERGNRPVRRLKLYFRSGNMVSIPYAFLPVIIYVPESGLEIRTGEMGVTVKGRGLGKLSDHLNEERVQWIKESNSGVDTGEGEVFVAGITVRGDLLA